MSEREIKKETDFWGNEKNIVYEDGERVGEIKEETRGSFLGFGGEKVQVEYDNDGEEVAHYKDEERGGFLGFGGETVEVKYSPDGEEESTTKEEIRGSFLGFGGEKVDVEYDSETGDEISQSKYEKKGGFLGFGGEWVRVTRREESEQSESDVESIEESTATPATSYDDDETTDSDSSVAPTCAAGSNQRVEELEDDGDTFVRRLRDGSVQVKTESRSESGNVIEIITFNSVKEYERHQRILKMCRKHDKEDGKPKT